MKSLIAFIKKEATDQLRMGKMAVLGIVFFFFGIMNPAIAKLTPLLLEEFADSLAESGMVITQVKVSVMDSWMQFFKNAPMVLIIFVLLESSIFTKEYTSGTLVLSLTKGLERYKVVVSKALTLVILWTAGYWLYFAATYLFNLCFWDNSVAQSLGFSAFIWWIFGLWVIGLIVLFSTAFNSNIGVLLGVGGVTVISYVMGLLPKLSEYLPTHLTDGVSLIYGVTEIKAYTISLSVAMAMIVACFVVSIPIFNKKQL